MVAAGLVAVCVLGALVVVRRSIPETVSNWIDRLRLIALAAAIPLAFGPPAFRRDQGHPVPMSRVHTIGSLGR